MDPRVKLVSLLAFLVAASVATRAGAVLLVLLAALTVAAISMIPPRHLMGYLVVVLPFLIAIALSTLITRSYLPAVLISVRILGSTLMALVLACSTPVFDQVRAMQYFKVPMIITSMLLLTYHFIFLFVEELERMKQARLARGLVLKGRSLLDRRGMRMISNTIGMLLVRVDERAARIADALRSRGFDGAVRTRSDFRFSLSDILCGALFVAFISNILLFQQGVISWPA